MSEFNGIGLIGFSGLGTASFEDRSIEWRDKSSNAQSITKDKIEGLSFNMVGQRGYLRVQYTDGDWTRFDGFVKNDEEAISEIVKAKYGLSLDKKEISGEGAHFGFMTLDGKTMRMESAVHEGHTIFELKLDSATQCVVPQTSNSADMEIQFPENDDVKEDEGLVSISLHFPPAEEDEDGNIDEQTPAQQFQAEILDTGVIKSTKGDIICEFSKEIGKFVSPRGGYAIQMTKSYMIMQGAQYNYKIKYEDIHALFLLDKPDGMRSSFVICLSTPIRQGNQKYHHLVMETNKMEHTLDINLTEEQIEENETWKGQLQPQMTMATASCVAKTFKVLSQTVVYIPKNFKSFREDFCVRCNYKTAEGLLYPLAKSMIFIHKPTILVKYEDIEYIEFQRYVPTANSATKNFDLYVVVKSTRGQGVGDKHMFSSIDRTEYVGLFDFFESKKVHMLNPQKGLPEAKGSRAAGAFEGMDLGSDEDEDDDDYAAGNSDHSASSDDSGTDESGESDGEENQKKKRRESTGGEKERAPKVKKEKGSPKVKGEKKPRKKKDPNAPKGAIGSYMFYTLEARPALKAAEPGLAVTEMGKKMGENWKSLSAEEKAPFEEKARADRERYNQEMAVYMAKQAADGADLDSDDDL